MRPPLVMPRPEEEGGEDALRQGNALGVQRHVHPPEGAVHAHAAAAVRVVVIVGRREARRLEEDPDAGTEVVHEAGGVVDEVDGGGVGVDADESALVQAAPNLQEEERSGEDHGLGVGGGSSATHY